MGVCASLAACLCILYACVYCVLKRINMMMMMTALVISDVLLQRNQSQLHHLELTPFGKWSVASPSRLFDWQVRYLDIYLGLFYVYAYTRTALFC